MLHVLPNCWGKDSNLYLPISMDTDVDINRCVFACGTSADLFLNLQIHMHMFVKNFRIYYCVPHT